MNPYESSSDVPQETPGSDPPYRNPYVVLLEMLVIGVFVFWVLVLISKFFADVGPRPLPPRPDLEQQAESPNQANDPADKSPVKMP